MKAIVLKRFKDKHNQKVYEIDEEIEVTEARFKEINSTAHGLLIGEKSLPDFESMTKDNIIKHAKEVMGIDLDNKMAKKEMIEKLGD